MSAALSFVHQFPGLSCFRTRFYGSSVSTKISAVLARQREVLRFPSTYSVPRLSLASFPAYLLPTVSLETNDVYLTGAILTAAVAWLLLWQRLTSLKVVPSSVTRKIIHVSCGPSFIAIWPLYSDAISAPILAALVPLCFISLLAVSGFAREDQSTRAALGRAISREGKSADALQGPLYYSVVLLLVSLFLFKSPIAVIVIAQLCCGDGAAELVGKRFGANSQWGLSWTGNKSIAGSVAFTFAALITSCVGLTWWNYWDLADEHVTSLDTFASLVAISTACAAVELIPKELIVDDNLAVAVTAAAAGLILIGSGAL